MSVPLELEGGGAAELTSLAGERAVLVSDRAAAPGSRVVARGLGFTYKIKAQRSIREGERFEVRGRLFDLTRDARLALQAALDEP